MVTLTDAVAGYLVQLTADGRSHHSRAQVARHARLLARWLAEQGVPDDVSALTPDLLARFLSSPAARLTRDGTAKRTSSVNALRTSMRVLCTYLHDAGLTNSNAARLVRRARCSVPLPKPFTEAEVARLLHAMAEENTAAARRDFVLLSLLVGCGIRIGSALAARVEDLDLNDGVLLLRMTKGGRAARVFVPRALRGTLRAYIGARAQGPLFRAAHGGPLSTRTAAWRLQLWGRRAGIHGAAGPHRARHYFATQLLARTGNLEVVRRAMTHRSIASTVIYLEVADSTLREALEA